MTAVLECAELDAGYGRTAVVRGLTLAVEPGQVLALLGPNGAGKTTTLLTLAGILPPLGGTITALGRPLPQGRPHLLSRRGVSLVPEDRALFASLTTIENIKAGQRRGGPLVTDLLDTFPALRKRANVRAGSLSGGEQQMLVMARALAGRPKALLVDEMSTGLAPTIVADLLQLVRRLADDEGTAVILVEQHVRLALKVSDRALVLVHGDPVLAGPASMLLEDHKLLEDAYLGRQIAGDALKSLNDQRHSPLVVPTPNGARVRVHDLGGRGADVLFVHATGFHGRVWEPVADLLGDRMHSWAVDLSGHGDSSLPASISWQGFGREVLAVADALPRPLTAIGHSLGGAAVTLAEMERPGTFDRVILYEPALPDDRGKESLPAMLRATERRRASFDSFDAAVENFASKMPTSDLADTVLRAYVAHGFRGESDGTVTLKCLPSVEARIYACPDTFETHVRLHPLDCPVALIAGTLTDEQHRRSLERAAERLSAPIIEMAGAGHFGPLQAPEAFAALVSSILDPGPPTRP